ncbi:MAG: hypothetical protein JSS27_15040 [Planctomycetes bacterium]|nr:hypothetical protein [Planctomycetota bacterium]
MIGIGAGRTRLPGLNASGRWQAVLLPAALAVVASFWLAAGFWILGLYLWSSRSDWQVSSGLLQVACGLIQLRVAWHAYTHPRFDRSLRWALVRSLFLGAVACYLLSLGVGPTPASEHLFRAALAAWYTISLLALVEHATGFEWLNHLCDRGWARLGQRTLLGVLALALGGEALLRLMERYTDADFAAARPLADLKLLAGSEWHGARVNSQGYWDAEFDKTPQAGRFRIAALGHEVTLSGGSAHSGLAQLERQMPAVDVYNFGAPGVATGDLAGQYRRDVAGYRPDLVLVFLSTARDLNDTIGGPTGRHDWRNVRLLRCAARTLRLTSLNQGLSFDQSPQEYESYLSWNTRWINGCRVPQDPAAVEQWQSSAGHLDRLIRDCQLHKVPVALVLVPADFQVSSKLRDKLARRAGLEANELDPELPQRRVAQFAAEHRTPMLDLLPVFRSSESPVYSTNQSELNEYGVQLTVEELGRWLQARYRSVLASNHRAPGASHDVP